MQSLLSTIQHSLSQSRTAFALRVFVSYDALGRRKESVVVDIEQPRPPLLTPRHTIRLITPVAPLSSVSPLAPSPPASLAPANPPSRSPTLHVPASSPASPSLAHSSIEASWLSPSPARRSATATLSTAASSLNPPPRSPSLPLPPASLSLSSSPSPALSSCAATASAAPRIRVDPPPSSTANVLTLPPVGIEDAADVEMDGGSDVGTLVGTDSGDAQQAQLARRKERKREKKKQWRRRQRGRGMEWDEEDEEKYGDDVWLDPTVDQTAIVLKQKLPARAPAACGDVGLEYTRRMTAVAQAGGYVSFDAFQKLESLLLECERAVTGPGADVTAMYAESDAVSLRVVLSNDSLPAEDEDDGHSACDAEPHG